MGNFRRSQRYVFHLPVVLKDRDGARQVLTQDVSYHGVFVRTDTPRAPNQLLRFVVTEPDGQSLELLGIVARCVTPEEATNAHPPGIGVALFGNARAVEARWVALIRQIEAWSRAGLTQPPADEPEPSVDPVRRAHVRRAATFSVTLRPDSLGDLVRFEVKDISEGGTFVISSELLPVGTEINLRIVHPASGEVFPIPGQVVRSVDSLEPSEKGMGIRFTARSIDAAGWDAFLKRTAPIPEVALTPPSRIGPGQSTSDLPRLEPPVLLGRQEGSVSEFTEVLLDEPPPILLDTTEKPVPVALGPGLSTPPPIMPPPFPNKK